MSHKALLWLSLSDGPKCTTCTTNMSKMSTEQEMLQCSAPSTMRIWRTGTTCSRLDSSSGNSLRQEAQKPSDGKSKQKRENHVKNFHTPLEYLRFRFTVKDAKWTIHKDAIAFCATLWTWIFHVFSRWNLLNCCLYWTKLQWVSAFCLPVQDVN